MVKEKKKRRKGKGKKVSLSNNVAPIIVENESKSSVDVDTLDDYFVMPTTCCDEDDWEDNDTPYNIENLFGTNLEN